jgi:hypothetical protein
VDNGNIIRQEEGVESIIEKAREQMLRWAGHIWKREGEDPMRAVYDLPVPGKRSQGRVRLRWRDMVDIDMGTRGLTRDDAKDRRLWKTGTCMRVPTPQCGKV